MSTQHAQTMGIVHHQPSAVAFTQRQQFGQGRQISIHAEHAVGHDHAVGDLGVLGGVLGHQLCQSLGVGMGVDHHLGFGQTGAIYKRSVVQRV